MPGLCANSCATSLSLYLTTSLFSLHFWIKTNINPTGWILGGVGITLLNTFLFLGVKFYLDCFLLFDPVQALFIICHGFRIRIIEKVNDHG
jgi:amino acid permease